MKKFTLAITIIFVLLLTSCLSQKCVEETYEIKKSNDLSNDIEKYGIPNNIVESTEKGYYVKTCTWNDIDGQEISCDYSSIEMRTCTKSKPNGAVRKTNVQKTESQPIQKVEKPHKQKTDYEFDVKQFGYPNDVSTYSSDGYYSKTCTWYNACGKFRSYDYDRFGKRTSKFESSPIR